MRKLDLEKHGNVTLLLMEEKIKQIAKDTRNAKNLEAVDTALKEIFEEKLSRGLI